MDKTESYTVAGQASKIQLAVDTHGNPITFIITDGTTQDVKVAFDLIDEVDLSDTAIGCADKNYDSDGLQTHIE